MQVHVVRDVAVAAGAESWLMLPGEVLVTVSAVGVSEDGAEALEVSLADFVDRGQWVGCDVDGEPMSIRVYRTSHVDHLLSPAAPVVMVARGALIKAYLSASHFAAESAVALQAVADGYWWASVKGELPEDEHATI